MPGLPWPAFDTDLAACATAGTGAAGSGFGAAAGLGTMVPWAVLGAGTDCVLGFFSCAGLTSRVLVQQPFENMNSHPCRHHE